MASKSYAKRNQHFEEKKPRTPVFTRANTSFEDWKVMVAEWFVKEGVDINLPSKLNFLHAWESDITPYGFAEQWSRRVRRNAARKDMGPSRME
jgi:hypothetical protein